ncbi:GNAT family N-acetyltransferase, partial [Muricomes intestini]
MQLRKLDGSEHSLTRELWEKVFKEDSKEFLDYYYFIKVRDNQIYVIEEDGEIRSMLQLNPYTLQVDKKQFSCNYIIAVATEEGYRKRGYMG